MCCLHYQDFCILIQHFNNRFGKAPSIVSLWTDFAYFLAVRPLRLRVNRQPRAKLCQDTMEDNKRTNQQSITDMFLSCTFYLVRVQSRLPLNMSHSHTHTTCCVCVQQMCVVLVNLDDCRDVCGSPVIQCLVQENVSPV